MKIKKTKRSINHKKLSLIAGAILLLIAIPLTYVYAFNGSLFGWKKPTIENTNVDNDSINYGPATPEQQQAGDSVKSGSTTDTPPKPTPIPGSSKKSVEVSITSLNSNSPNGPLQIRAQIGAVDDTGVCTLTLTSPGRSMVTKTASTQSLASISTCNGFDVPLSELSAGIWKAQIQYSSNALSGTASQDVDI